MNFKVAHSIPGEVWWVLNDFISNNIDGLQGFAQCSILLNMEFERVFYKNDFASGAALLNIYMICESLKSCRELRINANLTRWRNKLGKSRSLWRLHLIRLWLFYHREPWAVQREIQRAKAWSKFLESITSVYHGIRWKWGHWRIHDVVFCVHHPPLRQRIGDKLLHCETLELCWGGCSYL